MKKWSVFPDIELSEVLLIGVSDDAYCRMFTGVFDTPPPLGTVASIFYGIEYRGDFQSNLRFGEESESHFTKYLTGMGACCLKQEHAQRVPINGEMVPFPDRVLLKEGGFSYLEIKTKSSFFNMGGEPCVAIDKYYLDSYMKCSENSQGYPFNIVFIVCNDPIKENNGAYVIGLSMMWYLCKTIENPKYKGGMACIPKGALRRVAQYAPISVSNRSN